MEGKNHMLCSSAIVLSSAITHISFDRIRNGEVHTFYGHNPSCIGKLMEIDEFLWDTIGISPSLDIKILPIFALFIFVMLVGTLMTDCDKANSLAGQVLYIPVQHRTWLHAIWIPAIVFSIGFIVKMPFNLNILIWYALGWFLHEFMDSFSKMGNSYLYPFIKYNAYGDAKVKQGIHIFKFYYAGKPSEGVFVIITLLNCLVAALFFYLSSKYTINFIGEGMGFLS